MTPSTPSAPPGAERVGAAGQAVHLPARAWVENVETGQVVSIDASGLAALQSPWREITAEQAMRAHTRSAR